MPLLPRAPSERFDLYDPHDLYDLHDPHDPHDPHYPYDPDHHYHPLGASGIHLLKTFLREHPIPAIAFIALITLSP